MRCDGLVAEVADWAAGLEEVHARIAGAFARAEPRAPVLAHPRGLLGQVERADRRTLAGARGPRARGSPARLPGRGRGPGCWPICGGCWVSWSARTAGRWPRPPARSH